MPWTMHRRNTAYVMARMQTKKVGAHLRAAKRGVKVALPTLWQPCPRKARIATRARESTGPQQHLGDYNALCSNRPLLAVLIVTCFAAVHTQKHKRTLRMKACLWSSSIKIIIYLLFGAHFRRDSNSMDLSRPKCSTLVSIAFSQKNWPCTSVASPGRVELWAGVCVCVCVWGLVICFTRTTYMQAIREHASTVPFCAQ